jgi:hypothetical protein
VVAEGEVMVKEERRLVAMRVVRKSRRARKKQETLDLFSGSFLGGTTSDATEITQLREKELADMV